MSRVGKHAINIPANVKVAFENGVLTGSSTLGSFTYKVPNKVNVALEKDSIAFSIDDKECKESRSMWGTCRAQVANAISGLVKPFEVKADLVGVGYKAEVKGNVLVLSLGYSHNIEYPIPAGLKISCEKPTTIVVQGTDKQKVGQAMREIQAFRKPEPYKGKGVIIQGQFVYRKEGKKK